MKLKRTLWFVIFPVCISITLQLWRVKRKLMKRQPKSIGLKEEIFGGMRRSKMPAINVNFNFLLDKFLD